MLGLILIYFIWKYYSDLAIEHNKSKWGYGILCIVTSYLCRFVYCLFGGCTSYLRKDGKIKSFKMAKLWIKILLNLT